MKTATKTPIQKAADKYLKQAHEYFQKCKVIPDAGDLALYIVDMLRDDGSTITDDEYMEIFKYLGGEVEE